jgi:hypothetical protein
MLIASFMLFLRRFTTLKFMKVLLPLLFLITSISAFSQDTETNNKKEIKSPYKLSTFSFSYSGSIYNYSSIYLDHAKELYNFPTPNWAETDSMLTHDNRSEINARISFEKQLIDDKSYFFGYINAGICVGTGGRLKAAYKNDYFSHTDTATINSDPVTNLDTLIILQNEYIYNSTDVGFDLSYTISSPPKYTFKAETGIGVSGLFSVGGKIFFVDTESVNHKYLDQYNRSQSFNEIESITTEIKPVSQTIIRAYVPLILTYKLDRSGNFALTTSFSGGLEFQKPENGNFYSYPYFTIGIGCRIWF